MKHPQKIETVHVETLDGELCIYDWQRMEVHNLNPTAAKVWELSDGQTTPEQMAEQIEAELGTPHAEELVWMSLNRLEKAKLLEGEVVKPAARQVMTRRQMLKGLGVAAALLPVISSIVAPGPLAAQSSPVVLTHTWRLESEGAGACGMGFFDMDTATEASIAADKAALGSTTGAFLRSNTCAECYNALVTGGFLGAGDYWRWGATDIQVGGAPSGVTMNCLSIQL